MRKQTETQHEHEQETNNQRRGRGLEGMSEDRLGQPRWWRRVASEVAEMSRIVATEES